MCSSVNSQLGYCSACGRPRDTFFDGDDTPFDHSDTKET